MLRIDPTPNPNCLKVSVDRPLAPGKPMTFGNAAAAEAHPLAKELFAIPGVVGVFFFQNYCTVTKSPEADWAGLEASLEATFRKHLA